VLGDGGGVIPTANVEDGGVRFHERAHVLDSSRAQ
jgi:hypothetical protein